MSKVKGFFKKVVKAMMDAQMKRVQMQMKQYGYVID